MKKSTKDTYNDLAKAYEENVDHSSPYNTDYERPAMMNQVPEQLHGLNVLDAGCSAGWYSEALVERGATVTGIDLSTEMIAAAKRRLKDRATIVCHDLQDNLPFKANQFDFILSSLTLHYIKDWEFTFSELNRVLKPNGTLLFSVHHPFMDFTKFDIEDYFQKTLLTDTWEKPNITIDVSFYRRSLQETVTDTTKFFSVEGLIEPQPQETMKNKSPSSYKYLMENPHFLIIKAKSRK
ncbi:class I SAM-dependent methyltransferase [Virgibacillus necropolis]|uniref:class I SAM-dependent methyltransferase n=1 Tax=Virgibacillus necropolis TaxID=163877 RepID=UPI0038513296